MTPLRSETGLSRTEPIRRTSHPREGGNGAQRRSGLDPDVLTWAQVRPIALERDGWRCVGCGSPGPLDCHHRSNKGMGGSRLLDHVANAITICGPGNAYGCHGFAHRYKNTHAAASGLSVPQGEDFRQWSVLYPDGGWYLLDDDGDRTRVA
ncbi:hypothetical protein [Actinomycetospora aeridis]|uniref:HNH endonuclease n=1 Tax=Actinomycetospora aeridis TaxID=3129231 RepID=A0ABU8N165_9PSEU